MDSNRLRNGSAILMLSAGVVIGWFGQHLKSSSEIKAEAHRNAQLQAELANLRLERQKTQTIALTSSVLPLSKAGPSAAVPATGKTADFGPTVRDRGAAVDPDSNISAAEVSEDLSDQFRAEPVDPGWSVGRQRVIQERIGKSLPDGSRIISVECRTSMCRAEIAHQDVGSHTKFVENAFLAPDTPWEGSVMASRSEATGSAAAVSIAFFARENRGLSLTADQP